MNKESLEITLPTVEYIKNSELIKRIGAQCQNVLGMYDDYWTSSISKFYGKDYSFVHRITRVGSISGGKADETICGVRPILKTDNLKEIAETSTLKTKKGIKIVTLGSWYTFPKRTQMSRLSNGQSRIFTLMSFNNPYRCLIMGPTGYERTPLNWYYDEENNLLLSERILFDAPINFPYNLDYNGNIETSTLYETLNNNFLENAEILPKEKQHKIVYVCNKGKRTNY